MENIDETISKCNFDLISKFPSSFPLNAEKKGERHSFRKSRDRDDRESYESGDLIVWRTKSSWRISNSRSAQSATIIAFHDMPNQWNTCPASSRKASTEHPDAVDPLSATRLPPGGQPSIRAIIQLRTIPFRIMHPSAACVCAHEGRFHLLVDVERSSRGLQHQSQRHSCTLGTEYNAAGLTCVAGHRSNLEPSRCLEADVAAPISHPEFPHPEFPPLMAPQSLSLVMQAETWSK